MDAVARSLTCFGLLVGGSLVHGCGPTYAVHDLPLRECRERQIRPAPAADACCRYDTGAVLYEAFVPDATTSIRPGAPDTDYEIWSVDTWKDRRLLGVRVARDCDECLGCGVDYEGQTWLGEYLVARTGDRVRAFSNTDEIVAFLAPIDTTGEAAIVAMLHQYWWQEGDDEVGMVVPVDGGYEMVVSKEAKVSRRDGCFTQDITDRVHIDPAGNLRVLQHDVVEHKGCAVH